jgi:hypothetical protein
MENRERMEDGNSQLPRTRTSRVPVIKLEPVFVGRKLCHAISGFLEAMFWVAVAGKDGYLMATVLQAYSSVNDEPFCSSYP